MTTRGFQHLLALALFIGATDCRADYDMTGLGIVLIWVFITIVVLWISVAGLVFYLLRRQRPLVRFGLSGFVLLLPLFINLANAGIELASGWLHERLQPPLVLNEISNKETFLLGVALPAGSALEFAADEQGNRTLVKATPPAPIRIGEVQVLSLKRESGNDALEITLDGDQTINGWTCLASLPVRLHRSGQNWLLQTCSLPAQQVDNLSWPHTTELGFRDNHSWLLSTPIQCTSPCAPMRWHDLELKQAQGLYDTQRHLLAWGAFTTPGESHIGFYRFDGEANLERLANGKFQLKGSGHDTRNGKAVDCIVFDADGSKPQHCASKR